jgi:hypothetical protein
VDEGREQGGSRGLQGEAESDLKGAVRLKEMRAEALREKDRCRA